MMDSSLEKKLAWGLLDDQWRSYFSLLPPLSSEGKKGGNDVIQLLNKGK